jgi:hypothetical protein
VAKKNTQKQNEDILGKLEKYIEETDIPIVAEFAYLNKIRRQFLYESALLSDAIKRLVDKKEAQLERKGLKGEIDKTMAIFSLKQLGWSDKQEIITHEGVKIIKDDIK